MGNVNENDATELVTALYDRWYISLVRYALRTTENYAVAEDLAQETFLQLYQALRTGDNIEHPKGWTLSVLRRAMNRQMKDINIHEPLDEEKVAASPVTDIGKHFESVDIRVLLSVLTPREEEVLLLRLDSMKYRQIADQLGISMNSVNSLLARALRKLQGANSRQMTKERIEKRAV
jgi:RNA polymerase sigma-70 factor (ECF subfamily)